MCHLQNIPAGAEQGEPARCPSPAALLGPLRGTPSPAPGWQQGNAVPTPGPHRGKQAGSDLCRHVKGSPSKLPTSRRAIQGLGAAKTP